MKQRFIKRGILLLTLLCLLLTACGKDKPADSQNPTDPANTGTAPYEHNGTENTEASDTDEMAKMPWEAENAKLPWEYTLEEYEALTAEQRKAFRGYLGAAEYAAWLEMAEAEAEAKKEGYPWEKTGAKQPKDYTWAEYQTLTEAQKKAFMEHLGPYGLEAWLRKVQNKQESYPWDVPGAKQPKDYTWAEYQALTDKQQAAFVNHLGSAGYQNWLTKVQGQKETYPWEISGAKKPQAYTWEEYEALTANQKKAFRNYLGNDGFEAWLESLQEKENPWEEDGAKQPEDYTWEEYNMLTEAQKVAFQEFLGAEGFVAWREKVLYPDAYPWEESGAKQPVDYTWKDYEALTEIQQAVFQDHLGKEAMMVWLRKITEIPWEKPKSKQPEEYTLKEYETLEDPQQLAFRVHLGSEDFETWLTEAQNPKEPNPWEKPGAKQPQDYTWEEFAALTVNQQMEFQNYLGEAGFENWLEKVQNQLAKNPWEKPGAKQPKDYTLEEFEALTAEQQMAFQNYLGAAGFEAWLNKVQNQSAENPWEKPGAKKPQNYTWDEFEALTAAQQMEFQNYLGAEGFEAWLNKVQGQEKPAENPWEVPGAKQPADYTWAEFEALTAAQQMEFQNYLGAEGFEAWLNKVQNQTKKNPWEEPGAKQPADYTWADFEALTGAQQMAFQDYLGEAGFEAWLNRVQNQTEKNPWEKPGAKQPADYTWEEFEALTAGQQMAFQKYLGPDAFDAWLNRVLGL